MAKRRLDSLKNCRVYLASIVNQMDANKMNQADGKARAYIVKIIGDLIEQADLEARVLALESKLEDRA
jgi:hypothetical protein